MVGTTGFEPATSRTPSVRATRLRYVPTVFCSPRLQTRGLYANGEKTVVPVEPGRATKASYKIVIPGTRDRSRHPGWIMSVSLVFEKRQE